MKKPKILVGVMIVLSFIVGACGRDATVEDAIEGHWTMTDARLNHRPLSEGIEEYSHLWDIDSEAVSDFQEELDVDIYRSDDTLTIVDGEGEQTQVPYEIDITNENDNTLTLEYNVEIEGAQLRIFEDVRLHGEERESLTSAVNIMEVTLPEEQEMDEFTLDFIKRTLRNMHFEFDFEYVDEAVTPEETE